MENSGANAKQARQASAKNASDTVKARNTALIQWSVNQLKAKKKDITASNVASLAGMSVATARDYLQKMGLLTARKVKTAEHRAREKTMLQIAEPYLSTPHLRLALVTWDAKAESGKGGWVFVKGGEF